MVSRFVRRALLGALLLGAVPAAACPGDCDGSGAVAINELVLAVGVALGQQAPGACAAVDANGDGQVSIAELIGATNALLLGCDAPTPSPTLAASATPSASPSPSPSPTATVVNQPPQLATPFVYRGFAGLPIELPLGAADPEGGALTCSAEPLLAGMRLEDGTLRWTPADDQLGLASLPYTCRDDGQPPAEAGAALQFRIAELDACSQPSCGAAGCTTTLVPLDEECCGPAPARLPEAEVLCPQGRLLLIGRNVSGFGRLQNCNVMRFYRQAQSSAELRFHIRFSCLNTLTRVTVRARLESVRGVEFDSQASVFAVDAHDGFFERRTLRMDLKPGPYTSLENREANLTVTVTDVDGASVSESLRLILTSDPFVPDLSDP